MAVHGARAVYRLVLKNGLFGVGARLATLLVGLVMTPYLLERLGTERFAIWALASIATGSLGLFDLGLRRALIKYVAEELAVGGGRERLSPLLSSAFLLYTVVATALGVVTWLLVPAAIRVLAIPPPLQPEARAVFFIAGAGVVLGTALATFPAVCDGMQRMDVTNTLGVVWLVLGAGMTVASLERGCGLRGVALAQLVSIAGFYLSTVPAAWRLLQGFRISPFDVRREVVGDLFGFGWKVHGGALATLVARHLDKLLLSRWAGLVSVTSYELGLKVSGNAASLVDYLGAGLLPATSHLAASREYHDLARDYARAMQLLLLAAMPLFVFLFLEADVLMLAWLGAGALADAGLFARILAVGYLFAAIGSGMSNVCQGIGAPEIVLRYALVQLGLNLVLSLAFLWWFGPPGAAAGTAIALGVGTLYLGARLHPLLDEGGGRFPVVALGAPAAALVAASFVAAGSARAAGRLLLAGTATDRSSALTHLALEGLVFGGVYLLATRGLRLR